jgi:cytochrome c oxidase assembly factor CtaG
VSLALLLHGGHGHAAGTPAFPWHWDPTVLLGLGVAAVGYALLAWRLWRKTGRFERRAAASWGLGLAVVFLALESPLDAVAEESLLSAHMLQHGLLMSVAPPLLLLGLYPRLVVPFTRPVFKPLLRNWRAHAVLRELSNPVWALGLWFGVLYAWHLPALYGMALRNEPVHVLQHVFFLNAGLVFWLPVIEPVPALVRMGTRAKMGYLAAAEAGMALPAALLVWGPELYPFYESADALWGLSTEGDRRLAGLVMVVVDMVVVLSFAGWILLREASEWERKERRRNPAPAVERGKVWRST